MDRRLQGDVSLNSPIHDYNETGEALDWLVDPSPTQDIRLAEEQLLTHRHQALKMAIESLDPRERHIFTARHLTEDPPKLETLAAQYGISRERVRQLELRSFQKVKAAMQMMEGQPKHPSQWALG
jgi:RNA polymerase sigma-32 factor